MSETTTSSKPVLHASPEEPVALAGKRVHLISLGCPKNRVDSEVMVGKLQAEAYTLVDDPEEADVIVVNTCSFIQPATEESIETVLEMARYKEAGSCKKLVVTGCMVQRYGTSLEGELPEVDYFLGTGEYHRITDVLQARGADAARSFVDVPLYIHDEMAPRVNSWSAASAYLKISEGCDHRCAFCIIPTLRGRLRSRSIPSLVEEARRLADQGVVELNLISQDSTAYGRDLGREAGGLGELMAALSDIEAVRWIRLHYAYPHGLPTGLLEQLAHNDKVVPYLDIPLQHASGPMLKAMRRGVTREGQERILDRVREHVPDITLRTTFIVGFPGETDADFRELCDFVEKQQFDHVGVFTYYQEEGTPAATLPDQVPEDVKAARQAELMALQARLSGQRLKKLVGSVVDVLVEGVSEESELLLRGRTARQAPDVDGQVYIVSPPPDAAVGQIRPMRVTRAGEYDLVGELIKR
ncbi:MAG: 30S ribosomal protein S12 methylthiotransferase RimO [Alphaproteobacteria bacterium]|nr:30S ribosomal protein S12 methylthiotransferase RimO [Alphaproteobacteria bacterium]